MRQHNYYTYVMASARNGTLYIGVTSDLVKRVYEHREGLIEGFTKKYNVKNLVYFEYYSDIENAIKREKKMKRLYRKEKLDLIESCNPGWKDLYFEIIK